MLTEPCGSRSPGCDTVRPAACSLLVLTGPQSSTPGNAAVGPRLPHLAPKSSACSPSLLISVQKVLREKVGCRLRGSSDCPGSQPCSTEQCVPLSRGQPAAYWSARPPCGSQGSAQSERKVPSGMFELQSQEWQGLRQTKGNKAMSKRHVSKQ